jgi:hypothetical protein
LSPSTSVVVYLFTGDESETGANTDIDDLGGAWLTKTFKIRPPGKFCLIISA